MEVRAPPDDRGCLADNEDRQLMGLLGKKKSRQKSREVDLIDVYGGDSVAVTGGFCLKKGLSFLK